MYMYMYTDKTPPIVHNVPTVHTVKTSDPYENSKLNADTIVGIFLLIISVSGNFIAETLSCQMQKYLDTSIFAKNIVVLVVIYFSLGYTSNIVALHPMILAKRSIMIWGMFLIFNKISLRFATAVLTGLFVILVCRNYIEYYHVLDAEKNKLIIDRLMDVSDKLTMGLYAITSVGFALYFAKQYRDHNSNFSYTTFLFGSTIQCKSMQ